MQERQGRQRVRRILSGTQELIPARGEIWPLSGGGSGEELLQSAISLQADLCFFDRLPAPVERTRSFGLAAGAVVTGPWQRWMIEVGWEQAMLEMARASEKVQQGLNSTMQKTMLEIKAWQNTGIDMLLIADDIAYASGPYFGPDLAERFLLPAYKWLVDEVRKNRIYVGFHSDGRLDLLLPVLCKAEFEFYSLEPEAMEPQRVWEVLGNRAPLLTGLPADWLMPGGFQAEREGKKLLRWLESGPLIVSSACGLFHTEAEEALRDIYGWMNQHFQNKS